MMEIVSESIICCFCDKDLTPKANSLNGDDDRGTIIRYKCPGCERSYCSASCCSGHKEKYSCPGTRLKTPYVHMSKFDQKQFLDDYFFLEDINTRIERASRILPIVTAKKRVNRRGKQDEH